MNSQATRLSLFALGLALTTPALQASPAQQETPPVTIALLLKNDLGENGVVRVTSERALTRSSADEILSGIRLIDIDFSNRTKLEEFLPDRPRLSDDLADGNRLILPGGIGSIFQYRREFGDTHRFGILYVPRLGSARSVLELDGIGEHGELIPMLTKVAVSADGLAVLVATKLEAGGDLLEIDLRTDAILNRTAEQVPQEFLGEGLALASGWGFGISSSGILRFATLSNTQASWVTFADPQPTYFGREAVLSENGQFALTIAGGSATQTHPFTFSLGGSATCANPTPMHLRGSGSLPNSLDGPFMAVSNDGEDCAVVAFEGNSRELYFSKSCEAIEYTPFHLTQDALFHPYLDEIGLLSFNLGKLLFSAGDRLDPVNGGLTLSSYYRAEWGFPGAQPPVLDLAHNYESAQPPFLDYTSLNPVSVHMTPDRDSYVIHSVTGDTGEISGVRLNGHSGQLFTLLADVKEIEMMEVAGDKILISAEIDEAPIENQVFDFRTDLTGPPNPLIALPDEDVGARTVQPSGAVSFVAPGDNGPDTLWQVHQDGSVPTQFTLSRGQFGETLAVTGSGTLVFTVKLDSGDELLGIWNRMRPRILLRHRGSIQLLPSN